MTHAAETLGNKNELQDTTKENLEKQKQDAQEKHDTQTAKHFENIAKEPGTGTMTGLTNMRDFGMKTVDAAEKKIQSDPHFEKSGNQEKIFEAYEQVQNQFDAKLNAIHSQNLSPEEYGKAMTEALKDFEKNLNSAAETAN